MIGRMVGGCGKSGGEPPQSKANIRRKIVFAFCSPWWYFAPRCFQQVLHARFFEQCSKLSGT
jgi:hypothetical protein